MSSHRQRVLVVAPTHDVAERIVGCFPDSETVVRTDFAAAKSELDQHPPDLLVSEVRLGAFNGLHLAIRANGRGLSTQTILIGPRDSVLEAEASQQHAHYLTSPVDEARLRETVREMSPPTAAA
jgi:DNA-binding NtrC family response regulator